MSISLPIYEVRRRVLLMCIAAQFIGPFAGCCRIGIKLAMSSNCAKIFQGNCLCRSKKIRNLHYPVLTIFALKSRAQTRLTSRRAQKKSPVAICSPFDFPQVSKLTLQIFESLEGDLFFVNQSVRASLRYFSGLTN